MRAPAACVVIAAYNLIRHFLWQDFSPNRLYLHSFFNLFLYSPFLLEFFAGAVLGAWLQDERRDCGAAAGWLLALGVAGFALAVHARKLRLL